MMENNGGRVQLDDSAIEKVVGGVYITDKIVMNKDTGDTYTLLANPMQAFQYAMAHGKESESEIIAGMLAMGYIA